ncbi:MAG: hypothetical protein E6Q97_03310 [Desulfurellales bacterium]|nr:MAG: hypothetical protein E6Q97_03310 [Desulfurellales bacterium]
MTFKTPYHKANWLAGAARLDALLWPVQNAATRFLEFSAMERALGIFHFVRDRIKYVRDPGGKEQFADSAVVLKRGFDDCDGKARLFAALIYASEHLDPVGLEVELVPVFPMPDVFSHVTARVRWPKSHLFKGASPDGWLRAETILKDVPLGAGSEKAQRGPDGKIYYS